MVLAVTLSGKVSKSSDSGKTGGGKTKTTNKPTTRSGKSTASKSTPNVGSAPPSTAKASTSSSTPTPTKKPADKAWEFKRAAVATDSAICSQVDHLSSHDYVCYAVNVISKFLESNWLLDMLKICTDHIIFDRLARCIVKA